MTFFKPASICHKSGLSPRFMFPATDYIYSIGILIIVISFTKGYHRRSLYTFYFTIIPSRCMFYMFLKLIKLAIINLRFNEGLKNQDGSHTRLLMAGAKIARVASLIILKEIIYLQTWQNKVISIIVCILYNQSMSTHRGQVTHICVSNLDIIDSDNGLSPVRRQAIIWTSAAISPIRP